MAQAAGSARPPEADASIYLHPPTLARVASVELKAKMIVEGLSTGTRGSPYQGLSVEFAQHRPYVPGRGSVICRFVVDSGVGAWVTLRYLTQKDADLTRVIEFK
ncbi:MAG: hypothetical protein NTV94_11490 [Planctomycetota bacterium]|nr:hypothetical protein [Planctomycetota bacterium]